MITVSPKTLNSGIIKNKKTFWWRPVTGMIIMILITMFFLVQKGVITHVSCKQTIENIFQRNFMHANLEHLVSNIMVLFILSQIETQIGSVEYLKVMTAILVASVLAEFVANNCFKIPCSVGFSGVLFGLTAWELFNNDRIHYINIVVVVALIVLPAMSDKNSSIAGHLIGALAGVLVAQIIRPPKFQTAKLPGVDDSLDNFPEYMKTFVGV